MFRLECALVCVFITMMQPFTQGQICNPSGIQVCINSEQIKIPLDVLKFIPESKFDETCRQKTMALDCALKDVYVGGCDYKLVVSLYVQNNVTKAVCKDMADAYKSSSECFGQDGLEDRITECVGMFESERDEAGKCPALEYSRSCAREAVQEFDGCNESDKDLMGKLVDKYLRPFAIPEMYNCDIPDLLEEDEEEEAAVATTEMMTNATINVTTQMNVTTPTTKSNTTTRRSTTTTTDDNAALRLGLSPSAFLGFVSFTLLAQLGIPKF